MMFVPFGMLFSGRDMGGLRYALKKKICNTTSKSSFSGFDNME